MSATPRRERLSGFLSPLGCIPISVLCLGSLLILGACSSGTSNPSAPSQLDVAGLDESDSQRSYQSDAQEGEVREPIVVSRLEQQGVGVEITSNEIDADLVIRSEGQKLNYELERLYEPDRLIVRLPEVQAKIDSEKVVELNAPLVDSLILRNAGAGSELELALSSSRSVAYESEPIAGNLYLRLMPDQGSVADEAQAAAASNQVADSAPQEAAASGESLIAKPVATDSVSTQPYLKALRFESIPAIGQVVVADMESAGVFSLKRTAPSEYVLRLEDASFNESEIQTLMAPPTSTGIRTVRVTRDGNDTLLRVFATPGVNLEATPKNGSIILKPVGDYLSANGDIRAQAEVADENSNESAPEEATADEALEEGGLDLGSEEGLEELGALESEVSSLLDEAPKYTGRKISLDLQDTDIDNALRIIAEVSNLNIIAADNVTGKVTLRLIDVPWDQALDVILKTNGLDKVLEGNVMRIAPIEKLRQEREALKQARDAEEDLEPLVVKYIRVSYAKASELRPLVETVLTERGTVTFDERTNQLIIKDIRRGVKNVAELVARLDLRTPQVLLETQIVEATRSFTRSLGSELGFSYIQSPETGNPTGYNFPNSINVGGSVVPGSDNNVGSSFPVVADVAGGSAVSFLLDSADGTRSLDFRLSALENEGSIRVVSRPSVATTNNQQAVIKSVERVRVKTPQGGLSVATGAGAQAVGNGGIATEIIEIGIILEVTPQASPDYFVLLDINAKSSTFGAERVDDIPTEIERSATSSVLVSSGQTFAMGGIYKVTDSDSVAGVPFLKDIPFFGHLFRRQTVDNGDEELIFFITPRIIEGSFDDAAMKLSS